MEKSISVLVADDSVLMRTLLHDLLAAQEGIDIVATATNGKDAVLLAAKHNPDVIIMDVQMPELDGIAATKTIMASAEHVPAIIIFSAFTKSDADLALDCIDAGAFSCVHKPEGAAIPSRDIICAELCKEIQAAAAANKDILSGRKKTQKVTVQQSAGDIPLIVIGASTGGPPVLHELLEAMMQPMNAAILIVQHMPPFFTKSLAARLDRSSALAVKEAEDGDVLNAGSVYVAPGGFHMVVRKTGNRLGLALTQDPPIHGLRPAIDVTMQSIADANIPRVAGVILTGMGSDGAQGMRALHEQGAKTIVQDPSTCVIDSMVQSTLKTTNVSHTVDLAKIPALLYSFASHG